MIRTLSEVDAERTALTKEERRLRAARAHASAALRELGTGIGVGAALTNGVAGDLMRARGRIDTRLGEIGVALRDVAAAERRLNSSTP